MSESEKIVVTAVNDNLPVWDFSEYYSGMDDPNIQLDMAKSLEEAIAFEEKHKGKLVDYSGDELAAAIKELEGMSASPRSPGHYAHLLYSVEQTNPKVAAFMQGLGEQGNEVGEHMIFWGLELKEIPQEQIDHKIEESEDLQHYKPYLRDVLSGREHTLSEDVERYAQKMSPVDPSSILTRLYNEANTDLRFPFKGKGKEVQMLTGVELDDHLKSADEDIRKEAMDSRRKVFEEHAKLSTFVMNFLIKDWKLTAEARNHGEAPISMRNKGNDVEDEVVDTLIATVRDSYKDTTHRFFDLKAKMLGKEKLANSDIRAPFDKSEEYIPFLEAKEIILDAYNSFSPTMGKIAEKFFNEGWIDAQPRPGKRGGAFALSNHASSHPHVFVNYQGSARDVMTLAHELGHGIHMVLAAEKQGDLMDGTPLTLAETASIFGEATVFRSLMERTDDPKEKKLLLASKIEDDLGSISRQAQWVDFERRIHDKRNEDGELTKEEFAEIFLETTKERYGDAIEVEDIDGHDWCRIPHMFHSPFYMYAYSFGNLLVESLVAVRESGEVENFEDVYLNEILAAGGSKLHKELLEPVGIDLTQPDSWQKGLDRVIARIDELEVLVERDLKQAEIDRLWTTEPLYDLAKDITGDSEEADLKRTVLLLKHALNYSPWNTETLAGRLENEAKVEPLSDEMKATINSSLKAITAEQVLDREPSLERA